MRRLFLHLLRLYSAAFGGNHLRRYPTPSQMRAQHYNAKQQRCAVVIARAVDADFDLRCGYFPLFEQEGSPS